VLALMLLQAFVSNNFTQEVHDLDPFGVETGHVRLGTSEGEKAGGCPKGYEKGPVARPSLAIRGVTTGNTNLSTAECDGRTTYSRNPPPPLG